MRCCNISIMHPNPDSLVIAFTQLTCDCSDLWTATFARPGGLA